MDNSFQDADLTPKPLQIRKNVQGNESVLRDQSPLKAYLPRSNSLNIKKTRRPQPEKPQPPANLIDKRAFTTDGLTKNDTLLKATNFHRHTSVNQVERRDLSRQGSLKLRQLNRLASGFSTRNVTQIRAIKPEHHEPNVEEIITSSPQEFRIPSATFSILQDGNSLRSEEQQSMFVAVDIAWDLANSMDVLSFAATEKMPLDVAFVIDNSSVLPSSSHRILSASAGFIPHRQLCSQFVIPSFL